MIGQPVKMQDFIQTSFSGGINTAVPPEHIADQEAQDILNLEFTDDDHLRCRSGVVEWSVFDSPGIPPVAFPSRITSIHYYENEEGGVKVLVTSGNKLYASPNSPPNFVDVTGALVLPTDTFYQWRNFAGLAIGVNRAIVGNNPIKYDGTIAAQLGGAPPKGKYLEVWNSRLWIVNAESPSTVVCCALGNPEDWVVDNDAGAAIFDIDKDDGDRITGIYAFRGRLFVFKRKKIYTISAVEGTNGYDLSNLRIDEYAKNIGCISPYSIQAILDDVLFLSDSGIASLVSAPLGELKTAIVSQKVKELRTIRKQHQEISSIYIEKANQYWLMVPAELSARGEDEVYILDVRRIQEGILRWVRFNGRIAGTVAETIYVNGERLILIAGTDKKIYSYIPGLVEGAGEWDSGVWDLSTWDDIGNFVLFGDGETAIRKEILTKSFNFNLPFYRKLYHKLGASVRLLSATTELVMEYFFDDNSSMAENYTFDFEKPTTEIVWDTAIWDTDEWDGSQFTGKDHFHVIRQFKRSTRGRKAISVTFRIYNEMIEGFIFENLLVRVAPLNENRVNDIERVV